MPTHLGPCDAQAPTPTRQYSHLSPAALHLAPPSLPPLTLFTSSALSPRHSPPYALKSPLSPYAQGLSLSTLTLTPHHIPTLTHTHTRTHTRTRTSAD